VAYLIIGLIIFFILVWATYKSKTSKDPHRKVQMEKPKYRSGSVRRYARPGRPIIQTDEQRAEHIANTRDRYDPSIDRLDPHHKDYKQPESQ
jgi:hypothetical protein